MGHVLRLTLQNDPRVPPLSCITQPEAGILDERMSRNVDQGQTPTSCKSADSSSQWRTHELGAEAMKPLLWTHALAYPLFD
jgi:hypothetical protein